MKTKYFLYARKSTEDEERQVMSIEAQLAELVDFAKRENIDIAERFIESKSAKKPGREIFNEMIQKIYESKEPVGILAWHPDRLARNSVDGGQVIYLIDIGKIASLRFPTFWFEPTPQGLFMLQVPLYREIRIILSLKGSAASAASLSLRHLNARPLRGLAILCARDFLALRASNEFIFSFPCPAHNCGSKNNV